MPYISMTFTCPKCGGHTFSSANCTGPGEMLRYCTGPGRPSICGLEFPESQDWRYFHVDGVRKFKNRDEYDLVMDIIRDTKVGGLRPK